MFDNLLYQNAGNVLISDIKHNRLPNSLLFSGSISSGKLTAALELARVLSCRNTPKGEWTCNCPSCLKHKSLVSPDVLIAGPRDCTLEISAAKKVLLEAVANKAPYIMAVRYLFVRSVRKLTSRFNPVLWENDDKLSKISVYTPAIDELLEEIDPLRPMLELEKLEKITEQILTQCTKLESSFMYDSIPVAQMRNISSWARFTVPEGKKVIVLENADRMLESVRNALLKILEEPPEATIFILTTAHKSSIIPTILSRVRTYSFNDRTAEHQTEVVSRVFHAECSGIDEYLMRFLPVDPKTIQKLAVEYWDSLMNGKIPDVSAIVKQAAGFDPRVLLRLFFSVLFQYQRKSLQNNKSAIDNSAKNERYIFYSKAIKESFEHITIFNQSPASSLESLATKLLARG